VHAIRAKLLQDAGGSLKKLTEKLMAKQKRYGKGLPPLPRKATAQSK
jgi:hypothetical protein